MLLHDRETVIGFAHWESWVVRAKDEASIQGRTSTFLLFPWGYLFQKQDMGLPRHASNRWRHMPWRRTGKKPPWPRRCPLSPGGQGTQAWELGSSPEVGCPEHTKYIFKSARMFRDSSYWMWNILTASYCGFIPKLEVFLKMRSAFLAPILPRVTKKGDWARKAPLILKKHFDRTDYKKKGIHNPTLQKNQKRCIIYQDLPCRHKGMATAMGHIPLEAPLSRLAHVQTWC